MIRSKRGGGPKANTMQRIKRKRERTSKRTRPTSGKRGKRDKKRKKAKQPRLGRYRDGVYQKGGEGGAICKLTGIQERGKNLKTRAAREVKGGRKKEKKKNKRSRAKFRKERWV